MSDWLIVLNAEEGGPLSRYSVYATVTDRRARLELARIGCKHMDSIVYSDYAAIDLCGVQWFDCLNMYLVHARCGSCCKTAEFYVSEIHSWIGPRDFSTIRDEINIAQRQSYKCACRHESLMISCPYMSKGEIFVNVFCRNCGIVRPISARKIYNFEGYYL